MIASLTLTLASVCLAQAEAHQAVPKGVAEIKLGAPTLVFKAEEAQQGVAADSSAIYVIGNRVVGKYDRRTGKKLVAYECPPDGPLQHMNGGVVRGDRLYCSHSNYPEVPQQSSIEIFDTKTLKHIGTQSFGLDAGSLVWVDWFKGSWWVCFGQYNGKGGVVGKTNADSVLVKFDKNWNRIGGYAFPKDLVARWDGMTCSGGVFGSDGRIYATGHHAPEIHVLEFPTAGAELVLKAIISTPVEGQGLALDTKTNTLFQMRRKDRSIYVFDLPKV